MFSPNILSINSNVIVSFLVQVQLPSSYVASTTPRVQCSNMAPISFYVSLFCPKSYFEKTLNNEQ